MHRSVRILVASAVAVALAETASAQSKTITGEASLLTATVESIEAGSRTVTLKKPDGSFVTTVAPPEMKRFSDLKIGDKVTVRYYENMVIRLKQPGEKDVDTISRGTTASGAGGAGGTSAKQRTITATITQLDPKLPSITFSGPNNWKYSTKVQDKAAIAGVKVGDKVDITWTEATLLALEPGK